MSNDKQQTAVDWYANRLYEIEIAYNQGVIDTEVYAKSKTHALEQAKEMHRQEIINAVDGYPIANRYLDGNEYYEKTYGGNK